MRSPAVQSQFELISRALSKSSWPDLSRPSTPFLRQQRKNVDARDIGERKRRRPFGRSRPGATEKPRQVELERDTPGSETDQGITHFLTFGPCPLHRPRL